MCKNAYYVFENTKIWDAEKKNTFISGLPNLNLFHIFTRDIESNHFQQKNNQRTNGPINAHLRYGICNLS